MPYTLHHTGEIIASPDMQVVRARENYRKARQHICRFGCRIYACPAATPDSPMRANGKRSKNSILRICKTPKEDCPGCWAMAEKGKMQKTYKITSRVKRDLADRMAYMHDNRKHRILFATLTFGRWKRGEITESQANECFSNFVDRLKKEHNRRNYIAVRERGENGTRRIHFHIAVELPYIKFKELNDLWNSCIHRYCHYSPSAFYTNPDARFVKSTTSAVRYLCKYISKGVGTVSNTRVVFVSQELASAVVKTRIEVGQVVNLMRQYSCIQAYRLNDYCTSFSIRWGKSDTEQWQAKARKQMELLYCTFVRSLFREVNSQNPIETDRKTIKKP